MDLLDTLNIAGSGLTAQRVRLQTISSNLANARTTRTEQGGPYQRKAPVFVAETLDGFGGQLDRELASVRVDRIQTDPGVRMVHDPSHPDADADGYVAMPDIDVLAEMVDLMTTSRSYEANVNTIEVTRDMASRALEIGR
jgi:flagellar basal-body rod protein FlgC